MKTYLSDFIKKKRKEKKLNQEELAKELDCSKRALVYYESGERSPDYEFLNKFIKKLKIDPHELFEGKFSHQWQSVQPMIRLVGPLEKALKPEEIKLEDYYAAPLVVGKIAAGSGMIPDGEIRSLVWIYAPELRDRQSHELVAVQLDPNERFADSMRPTLEPGDIVLIDRNDPRSASDFKKNKIYAVRMGRSEHDGWAVKRLHADTEGIIIGSDNSKKYPPKRAWTNDLQELIIGRVVWGWRNLLEA